MQVLTDVNPVRIVRRAIHGVLLFDKPHGWTSNDAVQRIKRLFNAEKAGHTGTLDPMATGLLPILLGEATKFSADLLDADKTYLARVRLGSVTDTGDLEGTLIRQAPQEAVDLCTAEDIATALAAFRGPQQQVPPMYSALKRDGRALYEYARAGVEVARDARDIHIADIALARMFHGVVTPEGQTVTEFEMSVTCSKGTYIRVLAEDIGERLGCGAHLSGLRRTAVGHLQLDERVQTWNALETQAEEHPPLKPGQSARLVLDEGRVHALLAPVDSLLGSLPAVELEPEKARRFGQGQRLPLGQRSEQGRVRVYCSQPHALLGTGLMNNDGAGHTLLCPERLIREHST